MINSETLREPDNNLLGTFLKSSKGLLDRADRLEAGDRHNRLRGKTLWYANLFNAS
jgi:hypothetical protein